MTLHRASAQHHLLSSRVVAVIGAVAATVALASFGFRQVDGWTSYPVDVVVTATDQEQCLVEPLDSARSQVNVPCDQGTRPGQRLTVDYGGVSDIAIGTGINSVAMIVGGLSALAAFAMLGLWQNRRRERGVLEALASVGSTAPAAAVNVAGESLDDPVVRDRWRAPSPPPAGTPTKIRKPFAAAVSITLGVLMLPGTAGIASAAAVAAGLAPPFHAVFVGAVVAAGLFLIGRGATESVRWSQEGLRVRTLTRTTDVRWSDVHHVTAGVISQSNRYGQSWLGAPVLVTMTGEYVRVSPMQRTGGVYRPRFFAARAADEVSAFDVWLDGADVPVDAAYDTYRAWMLGLVSVEEVMRMSAVASSDAHPVVARDLQAVEESPPPTVRASKRPGRTVRVVGWVLLVPAAALFILIVPFAAVDVATGGPVTVLVTDVDGDDCTVAAATDPGTRWRLACRDVWNPGDTATLTVGKITDEPTSWVNVSLTTLGLGILLFPGIAVLSIGYLIGRSRPAGAPMPEAARLSDVTHGTTDARAL